MSGDIVTEMLVRVLQKVGPVKLSEADATKGMAGNLRMDHMDEGGILLEFVEEEPGGKTLEDEE